MTTKDAKLAIKDIPGCGGWWKAEAEDDFAAAYIELLEAGMTQELCFSLLERLYCAVASCYGD